ncbi:hypothetical protein GCM10027076_09790 [Nocardioides montaniterrae]
MLRRGPVDDEVEIDGELVVLVRGDVLLLGPVASRLIGLVGSGGVAADLLRDQLFAEFGEPESPQGAWDSMLAELERARLIEVVEGRPAM